MAKAHSTTPTGKVNPLGITLTFQQYQDLLRAYQDTRQALDEIAGQILPMAIHAGQTLLSVVEDEDANEPLITSEEGDVFSNTVDAATGALSTASVMAAKQLEAVQEADKRMINVLSSVGKC